MNSHRTLFAQYKKTFLEQLKDIAVQGLAQMYDPENELFCYRAQKTNLGLSKIGQSLRYTIISLLGLHRLEAQGETVPFDIRGIVKGLLSKADDFDNIGDWGLLLWLSASVDPKLSSDLLWKRDLRTLMQFSDARRRKTTELAWLLTGLIYSALVSVSIRPRVEEFTIAIYELIKNNYGGKGIFGHQGRNTIEGKLRGRIGSFADQVYPIYGLAQFAMAYNRKDALRIAIECAETICRHQGTMGQWWWHYDRDTGHVVGQYPVYSVHQHSMAPMALFALKEIHNEDFMSHIDRGLEWITGNNELNVNLIDVERQVIWRNFYRQRYKMRFEELSSLILSRHARNRHDDLEVLYESRPYCLGWLLYAFADKMRGAIQ